MSEESFILVLNSKTHTVCISYIYISPVVKLYQILLSDEEEKANDSDFVTITLQTQIPRDVNSPEEFSMK